MAPTTMMKTDKAFDDFLKGISFADFDVAYVDDAASASDADPYDSDMSVDDTAHVVFAGPIKVAEPAPSPTSVDATPMRLPVRKATPQPTPKLTPTPTPKPTGRASVTAQRRRDRRRDRRRNQGQRDRENEKRKNKQKDFVEKRRECFDAEKKLRGFICAIVSDIARKHRVSAERAVAMLPQDVRRVLERSTAAMKRYRAFTGQKHICEQLNRFPTWSDDNN